MPWLPTTIPHALFYFNRIFFRSYFFSIGNIFEQLQKKLLCFRRDLYVKVLLHTFAYTYTKHVYTRTLCSVQIKNVESGCLENSQHISHKTIHNFCWPRMSARCFYT